MYNFKKKKRIMGNSFITTMLNVIAYVTLIVQFILGICYINWPYKFTPDGPNWATLISFFGTGIIAFVFLKSWVIIVKAAEKYLAKQ